MPVGNTGMNRLARITGHLRKIPQPKTLIQKTTSTHMKRLQRITGHIKTIPVQAPPTIQQVKTLTYPRANDREISYAWDKFLNTEPSKIRLAPNERPVFIFIGPGAATSLSHEVFTQVDKPNKPIIIQIDMCPNLLAWTKAEFSIAKSNNYQQCKQYYSNPQTHPDTQNYVGSISNSISEANEEETASLRSLHYLESSERFSECQKTLRTSDFHQFETNIMDPNGYKELAALLTATNGKVVGLNVTNVGEWTSGDFGWLSSLPFAENAIIFSSSCYMEPSRGPVSNISNKPFSKICEDLTTYALALSREDS
jgi:hypothetical protein